MTRREELVWDAAAIGLLVKTYSPGDGVTRYRFFEHAPLGQDYFGPNDGVYTALGLKEARTYLAGREACK